MTGVSAINGFKIRAKRVEVTKNGSNPLVRSFVRSLTQAKSAVGLAFDWAIFLTMSGISIAGAGLA